MKQNTHQAMVAERKPSLRETTGPALSRVNDMVLCRNQIAICGKLITMDIFITEAGNDLSSLKKALGLDTDYS